MAEERRPRPQASSGGGELGEDGDEEGRAVDTGVPQQLAMAARLATTSLLEHAALGAGGRVIMASASLVRPSASPSTSPRSTSSTASSPSSGSLSPASSSGSVVAAARSFDDVRRADEAALHMARDSRYMQEMIREFCEVEPSGAGGHRDALLERWFSELDVGWVVRADQRRLQCLEWTSLLDLVEAWTRSLNVIIRVLSVAHIGLFKDSLRRPDAVAGAAEGAASSGSGAFSDGQFSRFAAASILRMLDFVDALAAVHSDRAPGERLPGMLQVFSCVAVTSDNLLATFRGASESYRQAHGKTKNVFEKMSCVFLRKRQALSQAVWTTMETAKTSALDQLRDDACTCLDGSRPAIGGAGIHKAVRLTMNHVKLLWSNDDALAVALQDHHFGMFVSASQGFGSVVNLILETVTCLEKRLAAASRTLSDAGLRYLFMLNNSHFIARQVESLYLPPWIPRADESNITAYMERYFDATWTPVISCLYDGAPPLRNPRFYYALLFEKRKSSSALARFEAEFDRVYSAQKMWKVPSPELRQRLRKEIIDKVIVSGFSRYLEERPTQEKNTRRPINTPDELEGMIKEMFEG